MSLCDANTQKSIAYSTGITRDYYEWELAMDMWHMRGYADNVVFQLHDARIQPTREYMRSRHHLVNALENVCHARTCCQCLCDKALYVPPKHVTNAVLALLDSRFQPRATPRARQHAKARDLLYLHVQLGYVPYAGKNDVF